MLAGKTLAEGARPDFVHVFGGPGIGVDALQELDLGSETVVTVTSNPGDKVVQLGSHGATPPEGAISYPAIGNPDAEDYNAHSDYFDPGVLADTITGERSPISGEAQR